MQNMQITMLLNGKSLGMGVKVVLHHSKQLKIKRTTEELNYCTVCDKPN